MLGRVGAKNKDVIQIYDDEVVGHITKYIVHKVLKGSRGISHAKGHDQILERPIAGAEGGFPFMARCYANIVVTRPEVEFGENFRGLQAIE